MLPDIDIVIARMQDAVDVVNNSEHDNNKIAACLFKDTGEKQSEVNQRPQSFIAHLSPDVRVGNSSQFIHAEVASIFTACFPTDHSYLCITDPMCPNCAKAICEAGIKHIYIDHKGMEKDFIKRRYDDFEKLSLAMMQNAGVGVSVIYRKQQKIDMILETQTHEARESDIKIFDFEKTIEDHLNQISSTSLDRSFALAKTDRGLLYVPEKINKLGYESVKYRMNIDPINRLLFYCQRMGLSILDAAITCNLYPSSRAFVNMNGYGIQKIIIGSSIPDHDTHEHTAATVIKEFGFLEIVELY